MAQQYPVLLMDAQQVADTFEGAFARLGACHSIYDQCFVTDEKCGELGNSNMMSQWISINYVIFFTDKAIVSFMDYTAKSLHLCNRHDELSDLYQGGYHIWYCIVTCQIDCQMWYIMMAYSDSVCYLQSVPKQHYVPEQCNIMYQNNYQYVPDHLHTCNNVSFFIAHLTTTKSAV